MYQSTLYRLEAAVGTRPAARKRGELHESAWDGVRAMKEAEDIAERELARARHEPAAESVLRCIREQLERAGETLAKVADDIADADDIDADTVALAMVALHEHRCGFGSADALADALDSLVRDIMGDA